MTDPHDAFGFHDNVAFSDTTETNFNSPAISISPIQAEGLGRRVSATNQDIAFSSLHDASSANQRYPAYTNKLTSTSSAHQVPSGYTNGVLNPSENIHHTKSPSSGNPTTNTTSASLNLASFRSQPWASASASVPYLHFAPQPIYEPTGVLINEHTEAFQEFDTPAGVRSVSQSTSESPPEKQADSSTSTRAADSSQPAKNTKTVNAFVPPPPPRSVLKRKADSLESPVSSDGKKNERPSNKIRSVSFERMSGRGPASPDETEAQSDKSFTQGRPPTTTSQQARRTRQSAASTPRSGPIPVPPVSTAETPGQRAGFRAGTRPPSGHPPSILPPEKVFPIQIGSDLFRLSGASISSDAPSYFTQFFEEQIRQNEESGGVRTLYIDRDPITFRDIARHLQGYYVKPQDGSHFVKLFADAQFYSLPRLIDQLFESEIFIQIGERHFQIPKDVFSEPGNSPNFFSLGFAVFFSTPGEVFPGLDRRGLLRPPSITPPYVPGRSAEIFAELLHLLRGYPLHIRNESHRAELLRDCRYFHLRGLEQKIIAHSIAYNLARERHEITLRLEDVKPSGVSFTPDASSVPSPPSSPSHHTLSVPTAGWVSYARPFTDETSYELVVEIGGESMQLDLTDMRADFHNLTKARVGSLFQVVANKMNLPTNAPLGLMVLSQGQGQAGEGKSPGHTPLSEDRVKVRFEEATSVTLDGERIEVDASTEWGRRMLYGPDAGDESQDEDEAMGEEDDEEEEQQPPPPPPSSMGRQTKTTAAHRPSPAAPGQKHHPSQQPQQQPQQRPNPHQIPQQSRTHAAPPPIQTGHPPTDPRESATSQSKKRKRPSTSNPSPAQPIPSKQQEQQPATEWIIRAAQWRLRVQPNPQDSIRGGLEIVFVGVKVDAFSGEKGRNEQRGFLSAG